MAGVNVLFQTIHSNKIKEKDEEIERLCIENENLKSAMKVKKKKKFPAVSGLFQTFRSIDERKEKEKDEEIEKLSYYSSTTSIDTGVCSLGPDQLSLFSGLPTALDNENKE